jgi:nicotinate phosphoribosyltransferase
MWLMRDSDALFMDLYELTMAQVYFEKKMNDRACFEVTIRRLPEHWGFFVMAGLAEVESYLNEFHFTKDDIDYLHSTKIFSDNFLSYLAGLKPEVEIRCLPEGTIFFPNEPAFELSGPLICAQILESYILNILGFSIIEATLAARISLAAKGLAVIDFAAFPGAYSFTAFGESGTNGGISGHEQLIRRKGAEFYALGDYGAFVY